MGLRNALCNKHKSFLTIQITVKNEFENLQKQKQTKKIEKCKKVLVPAIGQYF